VSSDKELFKRIASLTVHGDEKQIVFTTNDMLWNQLKRDAPGIAESFDNLFTDDMNALGGIYGEVAGILLHGLKKGSDTQQECPIVLLNALNTYFGAVNLFRSGHRLESLMLMRMLVESIAVTLHLKSNPEAMKSFQAGQLKSTKCISFAKKILPPLGELYGYLSDTVNHVHELHRKFNPLSKYTERDEAVSANFGYLRLLIWLLYVSSEFIFYDLISAPRYWEQFDKGYKYNPGEDVREWMAGFLNIDASSAS